MSGKVGLEWNEIGLVILKLRDVALETEYSKRFAESYERYVPKDGETSKDVLNEYTEIIERAGEAILSELERIKKSGEVINPVVFFVNKVSELAQIDVEASWKIGSFNSACDSFNYENVLNGTGVSGTYISMSNRIISECMKMIEHTGGIDIVKSE